MNNRKLALSKDFKIEATKAIIAISFFILTYLVLLFLAGLLAVSCIYYGGYVIYLELHFTSILFGLGLASLGVLVLIFLIKFLFNSAKIDRSHLVEIYREDQPVLFSIIDDLVEKVGTTFPKKIYLSSDVNACVFYDSSLWSMFFPVKKNLQIGMGLVNSVTVEELKAILAHEFGHFSQRSMKVGSYVYNLNKIIYNLLYENEKYDDAVGAWAGSNLVFYIFAIIAVKINQGIQWILRKLYDIVNIRYMALSREMEFHADEIAASVTGYEPLKNSLMRLSFADFSFEGVLNFYNGKISENIISENLYKDHSEALTFLANFNKLPFVNDLPSISLARQKKFDKSKLIIKDQWASHPSLEDRINRLEKTGFTSEIKVDSHANSIFADIGELQKLLSQNIFETVEFQNTPSYLKSENFISEFKNDYLINAFADFYNNYYNRKGPLELDLKINENNKNLKLQDLFSDEKVELVFELYGLGDDLELLKSIANKTVVAKSFDYDGTRYKSKNASALIGVLEKEYSKLNEKIKENDIAIYSFFKNLELQKNQDKLDRMYLDYFKFDKEISDLYELYNKAMEGLYFINFTTPYEEIGRNLSQVLPTEIEIKASIAKLIVDPILSNDITEEMRKNLVKYSSEKLSYFDGVTYHDENLEILYNALGNFSYLLSRKHFLLKKALLNYQENLLN